MKSKQITFGSLVVLSAAVACMTTSGCAETDANAGSSDADAVVQMPTENSEANAKAANDAESLADEGQGTDKPAKQKRLKRGEMPEEWIEPQRERVVQMAAAGKSLDLTFDNLKFDIEIGQPFERSLLSEDVKALDGKEITLSGYMKPSFKASGLKGFIFVRDDKECCFGPQAAIYDCVRVYLKKGTTTNYLVRPFKVRGKFYLKEKEGPDGAIWSIFNMKNAKVE